VTDVNSELWRDKTYKPMDKVFVTGVDNLADNSVLVCVAYEHGKDIFVLRDGAGKLWGVAASKLSKFEEMQLSSEWQPVLAGMSVPVGAEYKFDVTSGQNMARLSKSQS